MKGAEATPGGRFWRGRLVFLGRREDAALDLGARGRCIGLGEAARGALALHLGELIAIDREVVVEPARGGEPRAQQRDQQHADRARSEEGEEEFQHYPSPTLRDAPCGRSSG